MSTNIPEWKRKYFEKVASQDAITCTWYRLLDVGELYARYVWMQLPLFDLYQLGIGLEFSMLPYEFQPFAVDFDYSMPNMDELMQGIWVNFTPIVYELEFPWSFDWDEFNNFLFDISLFRIPMRKAKYGKAKFFGYIYDPSLAREYIAEAFSRLRLIRKPDLSWKTAIETVSEVIKISDVAVYEIVSRFFLLSSAQDNSFCLGLSLLGSGRLNGTPDGGAVIPFITPEGEIKEVKYWTLENLMFGFILGITPLGYGVLTPKTPMFKMEEGKKNPEILDFIMNKARKSINRLTLTTWAYSNYNKPEEMVNFHKSEKTDYWASIQYIRTFIENLVYNAIAHIVKNPVLIRQYQNAVLQAVAWKSKRHHWGFKPFRDTPEKDFKEWWVLHWKEMGLDEALLRDLYDRIEPYIEHWRQVKYDTGARLRTIRRRRAFSPYL